jgi:hypothetical protein
LANIDAINGVVEPITHVVRASAFEGAVTWRLGADRLEREQAPGTMARLPYAEIAEVRLSFAPSRFDRVRYRCEIRPARGGALTILSTHYAGVDDFEDRAASYAPFVRGLIARVAAANPRAQFRSGKTPFVYVAEHAFLVAMLALLLLILFLVGDLALGTVVLIKLGLLAAAIPLLIVYARKNWPRKFAPDAIPAGVIPAP